MRSLQARFDAIGDTEQQLRLLQMAAVRFAKIEVPRKTGNLGRTIRPGRVTKDSALVEAGGTQQVGYALYVHEGTKAHTVRPRRAKALRFATGGNRRLSGSPRKGAPVVFSKWARIPARKGNPFLVRGAQRALREAGLADNLVELWNKAG